MREKKAIGKVAEPTFVASHSSHRYALGSQTAVDEGEGVLYLGLDLESG